MNLERYGINVRSVTAVTTVAETQSDDNLLEDINNIASSIPTTQMNFNTEVPLNDNFSLPPEAAVCREDSQSEMMAVTTQSRSENSVITIGSIESNPRKHQLLSKDTESDFLEDHLLQQLDTGTNCF